MTKAMKYFGFVVVVLLLIGASIFSFAQSPSRGETSYSPVAIKESLDSIMARMKAAKSEIMKRQMDLLQERGEHSEALRIPAGAEVGGRLHRVRAEGRLF